MRNQHPLSNRRREWKSHVDCKPRYDSMLVTEVEVSNSSAAASPSGLQHCMTVQHTDPLLGDKSFRCFKSEITRNVTKFDMPASKGMRESDLVSSSVSQALAISCCSALQQGYHQSQQLVANHLQHAKRGQIVLLRAIKNEVSRIWLFQQIISV